MSPATMEAVRLVILTAFAVFILVAVAFAVWLLETGRREIDRNRVPPSEVEPKEPQ